MQTSKAFSLDMQECKRFLPMKGLAELQNYERRLLEAVKK